jgi:hypothetical protein
MIIFYDVSLVFCIVYGSPALVIRVKRLLKEFVYTRCILIVDFQINF